LPSPSAVLFGAISERFLPLVFCASARIFLFFCQFGLFDFSCRAPSNLAWMLFSPISLHVYYFLGILILPALLGALLLLFGKIASSALLKIRCSFPFSSSGVDAQASFSY
jgi:hypothetical protein